MERKLIELVWSKYLHWCIKVETPDSGWDEHRLKIVLGFYKLFCVIRLWKMKPHSEFGVDSPSYGIAYHNGRLWFYLGKDNKTIRMPWDYEMVRWDLLLPDGSTYYKNQIPIKFSLGKENYYDWHSILNNGKNPYPDNNVGIEGYRVIKFTHRTTDGTLQNATITLTANEREWRPISTKWLPIFKNIQTTVNCDSDIELGERAGSWKGGLMGWSIPWNPKIQTMEEAFWIWYGQWDGK